MADAMVCRVHLKMITPVSGAESSFSMGHVKGNIGFRPHTSSKKGKEGTDSRKCLIAGNEDREKLRLLPAFLPWISWLKQGKQIVYCVL